jgi:hypothetical protein
MLRSSVFFILTILFVSCSHIVATNYPGEAKDKLPESWKGQYSIEFPSYLAMMMESADTKQSKVHIMSTMIRWTQDGVHSTYSTSDSLKFSELNGNFYISLGNSHNQYSVFKVVKVDDGFDLFGLTAADDVKEDKLSPYFKDIKELETNDENDETGINLYQVTIIDKKLDSYYESGIPSTEPIKLRKIK